MRCTFHVANDWLYFVHFSPIKLCGLWIEYRNRLPFLIWQGSCKQARISHCLVVLHVNLSLFPTVSAILFMHNPCCHCNKLITKLSLHKKINKCKRKSFSGLGWKESNAETQTAQNAETTRKHFYELENGTRNFGPTGKCTRIKSISRTTKSAAEKEP